MSSLTEDFLKCFNNLKVVETKGARIIFECQKCHTKYSIDVIVSIRGEKA